MGDDLQVVTPSKESNSRYIAYFLEASALAPEGPTLPRHRRDQKYDIRNGFRFSLTDPEAVLPAETDFLPMEK